jgi:outer membrane beta-barrel protein
MSALRLPLAAGVALMCSAPAWGQEALEQAVVRYRLYAVHGRLEASFDMALLLQSRLVDHDNFTASVAYNLAESWALELRAGYAVSQHTGLANHLAADLLARTPNGPNGQVVVVDDLSNLWEMKGNLLGGVRWAPIYGKLSLFADTSLHFQAYLWLGAGGAMLHRQSVVYCQGVSSLGACDSWLSEDRTALLGSGALGMRFFTGNWGALRLELRNYVFKDSYLVNVDRSVAQAGGTTGQPSSAPGWTNLVMLDLGITFFL